MSVDGKEAFELAHIENCQRCQETWGSRYFDIGNCFDYLDEVEKAEAEADLANEQMLEDAKDMKEEPGKARISET